MAGALVLLYGQTPTRIVELTVESVTKRPGRAAALTALAADLPAPVLAGLLGMSLTTATRWSSLAAHDNAEYVAARRHDPTTSIDVQREQPAVSDP